VGGGIGGDGMVGVGGNLNVVCSIVAALLCDCIIFI